MATKSKRSSGQRGRRQQPARKELSPCLAGNPLLVSFLVVALFVAGNLCAWQENVRPKLYVSLVYPSSP
ncbi:semaphorin-1A-like isoform X4 [Anopheles sinensis]|uniref:Semaphorin-1A-like isoform X4 n=1 Tax=Anopheles sinensis TaxID=74873 RepID=A0A084WQQ4_ANOSI|nr:semaphorin-1A-like isoform X4 [Anopheles sinensis]